MSPADDRLPRRRPRTALVVLGLALAFVLGIALGEALNDNPSPGGTQSIVRTLNPLPLAPAARQTVTVTVTNR